MILVNTDYISGKKLEMLGPVSYTHLDVYKRQLRDFLGVDCLKCDVNSMKPLDNLCHPVSVIKDAVAHRLKRIDALRPDDLTAEGQTRADIRIRIRGTVKRTRTHDTAIRIRAVEPTPNHTAGSCAYPIHITIICT